MPQTVDVGRGFQSGNKPHKSCRKGRHHLRGDWLPCAAYGNRWQSHGRKRNYKPLYEKEKEKSETWMSLWGFQSES